MRKHALIAGILGSFLVTGMHHCLAQPKKLPPPPPSTPSFKGYQLYPTLAGMWAGAYRQENSPRLGAYRIEQPYLTFSNLVVGRGQAGPGAVFSHELIAITQDKDILLMNGLGDILAVFDLRSGGYQTWPSASRSWGQPSSDQQKLTIKSKDGGELKFEKTTQNFKGDNLYLLSGVESPGGKQWSIQFTWDELSQTPEYSRIGPVVVAGSFRKGGGALSFKNEDAPLSSVTYTSSRTKGPRALEARDAAGALIARYGFWQDRLLSSITNRYGYTSTLSFTKAGLVEKMCNHLNVCTTTSYDNDTITIAANTSLYPTILSFQDKLLTALRAEGVEGTYSYIKTDKKWSPYLISSASTKSPTGSSVTQSFKYDSLSRLTEYSSNVGSTKISYSTSRFAEPIRIISTMADNTVTSTKIVYDKNGRVSFVFDKLANTSGAARFRYDTKGRLIQYIAPSNIVSYTYGDPQNPDSPTQVLVNGQEGAAYKYNPHGFIEQIAAIPAGPKVSMRRGSDQSISELQYTAANNNVYSTAFSYQVPGYINGESNSLRTAAGALVGLPSWNGTWDSEFRNLVQLTTFDPNTKQTPEGPRDNPLWFQQTVEDIQEASAKPQGVKSDASGCSPCAGQDWKTGDGRSPDFVIAQSRCDGESCTRWPDVTATVPAE